MTEQFSRKAEAWSARFSEPMSELLKRYTASVSFDRRLALVDIEGSLAHAEMLHHVGMLSDDDHAAIVAAWRRSATRSRPAASPGRSTSRTCTSTSSGA